MIYCLEAKKQHHFLRILSFIRANGVQRHLIFVEQVQNPTLIYLNLSQQI